MSGSSIARGSMMIGVVAIVSTLCWGALRPENGAANHATAAASIATLQSPLSSLKDKSDACRYLAIYGGKDAMRALVPLLADSEMSHMARYALERIPGQDVDAALRSALGGLRGRELAGTITTIGVRRDIAAIQLLLPYLTDADKEVASASARALGQIGTLDASRALLKQWGIGKTLPLAEGLMRAAEVSNEATREKIHKVLQQPDAPPQIRAGALYASIITSTREQDAAKKLYRAVQQPDPVQFTAALRVVPLLPGSQVTRELMRISQVIGPERGTMLMQAVAKRGDSASLPMFYAALQDTEPVVRVAAARAIAEVAGRTTNTALISSGTGPLVAAVRDSNRDVASAAFETLASIRNPAIDRLILEQLESKNPVDHKLALNLAERRRMTNAVPQILTMVQTDKQNANLAVRRVGELGGPAQIPAASEILLHSHKDADLEAAEAALARLLARSPDKERIAVGLASRTQDQGITPEQRLALLRVLGTTGVLPALQVLQDAATTGDSKTRMTALEALENWPNGDAAPILVEIARTAAEPDRSLALRGYIRAASNTDSPATARREMCRQALVLVQSEGEKRQLIAAIAALNTPEAVSLLDKFSGDPAVKQEAQKAAAKLRGAK